MIGFRFQVGGDWWNYLDIFNNIRRADLVYALTRTDPGYGILNWIAAEQRWSIWFPNLVCGIIFTWGLVALSRQQSNPPLALAVSIYLIVLVGMGFTRQSAALGFVMLAISEYYRGHTLRMLVFLAFATAFHTSAMFVIPLIGLAVTRRGILVTAMFALLAAVLAFQFAGHFQDRYGLYTTGQFISAGAFPRLALIVLPGAIFLAFRQRFTKNPAELRLWTIFAFASFALLALLIGLGLAPIVDRLGFYLNPLQIFVLSRAPYAFGSQSRPSMFLVVMVIAYSLVVVVGWLTFGRWGEAWIPYKNYLWEYAQEGSWPASGRR